MGGEVEDIELADHMGQDPGYPGLGVLSKKTRPGSCTAHTSIQDGSAFPSHEKQKHLLLDKENNRGELPVAFEEHAALSTWAVSIVTCNAPSD